MAKKVRRKPEEEAAAAFEFPHFDEDAFALKEFELGRGLAVIGVITLGLGLLSWAISTAGTSVWIPLGIGIVTLILSPFLLQRVVSRSGLYTKGDWAGLLMMEFFGWFGLWFLLLNVAPAIH